MSRSISPSNSDVSLRPLRRASPIRGDSIEPLEDETVDSANELDRGRREAVGYVQGVSKLDAENPPVAKPLRSTFRIWILEFLSIFLAFGSLASIVTLLVIHQGRPLPQWPALVSINSLVAIFSAILKAALVMPIAEGIGHLKWKWFSCRPQELGDISLFDQASRGPWGSTLLIARQLGRPAKAYLAILGALITIGALAVDPFSQALLEYQLCHSLSTQNASVPRTNEYTGTAVLFADWHGARPAKRMSAALYDGLVMPHDRPSSINVHCPSGECDFGWDSKEPYFSSLAMCHSCKETTHSVVRINGTTDNQLGRYDTNYKYLQNFNKFLNISISSSNPLTTHWSSGFTLDVLMLTTNKTCNLQGSDTSCSLLASYDYNDMSPFAARCSLSPCVKNYQARVINHEYTEKEIGREVYLESVSLEVEDALDLERQIHSSILTNYTYFEGKRIDCSALSNPGPGIIPFRPDSNVPWHLPGPIISHDAKWLEWGHDSMTIEEASKLYPRKCIWLMENYASYGLDDIMETLMEAELTSVDVSGGGSIFSLDEVRGNQWLQNAYNQGRGNLTTIERMVRGLANGVTTAMRNYPHEGEGDPTTGRVVGERGELASNRGLAYQVETCIVVNWGWIVYPIGLLFLQISFCAAMLLVRPSCMAAARDAGEFSDWKSSPLVLVSLSWSDSLGQKLKPLFSAKDIDDNFGKTKVMLRKGESDDPRAARWQLVEC